VGACLEVDVRAADKVIRLGDGYIVVQVIWTRPAGAEGPDVLVRGDWGGSDGDADLYAVRLSPKPVIEKLSLNRADGLTARTENGRLRFDALFGVEFFNGASHAAESDVPLPITWAHEGFALDLPVLLARRFPAEDLSFRRLAARYELDGWANAVWGDHPDLKTLYPPAAPGGTPVTVQALLDLMLAGYAGEARQILHDAWPPPLGGEDAFWNDLCKDIVRDQLWTRFDLKRLPDAAMIETSAARSVAPAP
jgi:hypothetical protein